VRDEAKATGQQLKRKNRMRARRLVCKAIRQIEWESFEIPDAPAPHEVVVRSACSLISAGTELAMYSGSHIGFSGTDPPQFPIDMGYALAGAVQAVGREVTEWAEGDRVVVYASHGDWALCDVRTTKMWRLPPDVTLEQGALAVMGGISAVGVRQGRVTLGETVIVLGLGLIGQFAAQLSHLSGARPVIGVDLLPSRVRIAGARGIHALNPDRSDVRQIVNDITGGQMAEVVIEATGNPHVVKQALDLAGDGGRVVLLGSPRGTAEIDLYKAVHHKGVSLIGAHARVSGHPYTTGDPWTRERNLDLVLGLFADGSLQSEGLISHRIQPDEVGETYEMLVERPNSFLGVLIEWKS